MVMVDFIQIHLLFSLLVIPCLPCSQNCGNEDEAYLLIADQQRIVQTYINGTLYRQLILPSGSNVIAVDYDARDDVMFWSDVLYRTIYMSSMNGEDVRVVVNSALTHPDGLAWDWITKTLYWTDFQENEIEVIDPQTMNRKILLTSPVGSALRAIILDPSTRMMYWTDWGDNPRIERASMDGGSRIAIITTSLGWPNGITLDYNTQTLYWVEANLDRLESSAIDGSNRSVLNSAVHHPFGITLFMNTLYWSDWFNGTVVNASLSNATTVSVVYQAAYRPNGLRVVSEQRQPLVQSSCSQGNGGCDYLCLLSSNSSQNYTCHCPDTVELSSDGYNCFNPDPPRNLQVSHVNGSRYSFTWETTQSCVQEFLLTCSPVVGGIDTHVQTIEDSNQLPTVLVLVHGATYHCSVIARNGVGDSDRIFFDNLISTPEIAPTGPPENFSISTGTRMLTLTWDPPLLTSRNGLITHYTLECSGQLPTVTALTEFTYSGLIPYTEYTCSVFASNTAGNGPPVREDVATQTAEPDAPPTNIKYIVHDGTIVLSWDPPLENLANGIIVQYSVLCTNGSTVIRRITSDQDVAFVEFAPDTFHNCTISAATSAGEGPWSDPFEVFTGDVDMAAQPVTAGSNYMTVIIPTASGGVSLVIVLTVVICAVLVYRRRRQRPLFNTRDGFHLTNTRLQMNPCEAYSMTVKRGENTRQDDDYLTMNSRDFYSGSAAGEEEPVYDVVH